MDLLLIVTSAVLAKRLSILNYEQKDGNDGTTYKKKDDSSCFVIDSHHHNRLKHWNINSSSSLSDNDEGEGADDGDDDEEKDTILPFHKNRRKKDIDDITIIESNENFSEGEYSATASSFSNSYRAADILFRWILFASLCLFSLCIMETLPFSSSQTNHHLFLGGKITFLWILKTDNCHDGILCGSSDDSDGGTRYSICISTMYTLLTCIDCILIIVVAPILAVYYLLQPVLSGLFLATSRFRHAKKNKKYQRMRLFLSSLLSNSLFWMNKCVVDTLYRIVHIPWELWMTSWKKKKTFKKQSKNNVSDRHNETSLPYIHSKQYFSISTRIMSIRPPSFAKQHNFMWYEIVRNQTTNHPNWILSCVVALILSYWLLPKVTSLDLLFHGSLLEPVCTLGVFVSSVLDGFGTISMIYRYLAGFALETTDYHVAIQCAEKEIHYALKQLEEKKNDYFVRYNNHNCSIPKTITAAANKSNSNYCENTNVCAKWWKRLSHLNEHKMLQRQKKEAEQEIKLLENLARDLIDDLADIRDVQRMTKDSRSRIFGSLRFYLGIILSIVLFIRLLVACRNTLFSPTKQQHTHFNNYYEGNNGNSPWSERSDPVTSVLVWLVGHHVVEQKQYDSLSQVVSFLLTAFVSGSQIRNCFHVLQTLCRRIYHKSSNFFSFNKNFSNKSLSRHKTPHYALFSKNNGSNDESSSAFLTCVVSSCMGSYFLCCIVSTKNNIPLQYQLSFKTAIGKNASSVIGTNATLRYKTFVISSILATLIFLLSLAMKKKASTRTKRCGLNHYRGAFAV